MFRVIRVMEYEFADYDAYEGHIAISAVPFNGIKQWGKNTIRSTALIAPIGDPQNDEGLTPIHMGNMKNG